MINRELHEALGYCGHEWEKPKQLWLEDNCLKCGRLYRGEQDENPDYKADPRLVIREMEKRNDFDAFCKTIGIRSHGGPFYVESTYIMDDTGKLATLARDWLKGGRDGKV